MTHEFTPDWKLSQQDQLQVHLSIALAKHVPGWPGATDEQLAAVAADLMPVLREAEAEEREACAAICDAYAVLSQGLTAEENAAQELAASIRYRT
jgi:hypothetical protein